MAAPDGADVFPRHQSQLLELHRTQEGINWAVGSTAATVALQDLLRAVVEVEFAVLAGVPALGDGDVVTHAGELEGMVVQLDWRFCVAHYGQKPPVEAPTRGPCQWPRLCLWMRCYLVWMTG